MHDALGCGGDDEAWTRQLVQCDDAPDCLEQMHFERAGVDSGDIYWKIILFIS